MDSIGLGLLLMALVYGFYNGMQDSSNIVATMISTRAIRPRVALWMAAICVAMGPLIFGVAVATTIGKGLAETSAMTPPTIIAALLASITWSTFTLRVGIPSSSSHALIGGIIGAVVAGFGFHAIIWSGLGKVVLSLVLSPVMGLIGGYYAVRLTYFLSRDAPPSINRWFQRGQVLSGATLALAHGTNGAQKTMGIMAMALVATGQLKTFSVPLWVVVSSALAMSSGTLLGSWSLIRTLSSKFYRVRPIHGFAAQSAATLSILMMALVGGPSSTTHVVSTAIVGAGGADRLKMVRWQVITTILASWVLTIPMTATLAMIYFVLVNLII
ncbi:MAG: inorganic phosphate transporter [Anaerolineales bacterium]|nr:inorganic phosphate transporter [Anaerolineales bacterium]